MNVRPGKVFTYFVTGQMAANKAPGRWIGGGVPIE